MIDLNKLTVIYIRLKINIMQWRIKTISNNIEHEKLTIEHLKKSINDYESDIVMIKINDIMDLEIKQNETRNKTV